MNPTPPTFAEFADFIREFSGHSSRQVITLDTQFERDLGITGDDGDDLLVATEKRFGVQLMTEKRTLRETFSMAPNEYLFHSEGFGCNPFYFLWPFGEPETVVIRAFTVGELYRVVCTIMLTDDQSA